MSRSKKSLKQKLAMALSVINALNMAAPIALPYVNVARNVRTEGGNAEPLSDGLARAFYGTAQAEEPASNASTTVGPDQTETRGTVESGGKQTIEGGTSEGASGGVGIITNLNNGGSQVVNGGTNGGSGGTGTVNTLNSGGVQTVNNGGTGNITSMTSGLQTVNSGGNGTVTTMNGGTQTINSTGTGTIATMSGGSQVVSGGGTGKVTSAGPQGIQIISGGSAFGTVKTLDGIQKISAGGVGSATVMGGYAGNAAHQEIYNGGTGTIGTMNYGEQEVNNGGSGTVTNMNGGTQNVNNGGVGTVTSLQSGGTQVVYSGGISIGTTIKNGGVIEENGAGGTVTDARFEAGGTHRLVNGATKSGLVVSGHILEVVNSGTVTSATVQSGGTANVVGGGIALNTTVINGGTQNVSNGGKANDTTVNSGGVQNVNNGGTATDTTVGSGGVQTVASGGTVANTIVSNGGKENVLSGGTVASTSVCVGGVQNVLSGGESKQATIDNGGVQYVSGGGTATDTIIASGGLQDATAGGVISGGSNVVVGTAKGGTLVAGATQKVEGGTVIGTVVSGTQVVESGGKAENVTVNGGTQTISTGGTVTNAILNGGTQTVENGGVATSTTLNGGTQNIASGGTVTNATLNDGVQNIESGGSITSATVNGGTQNVSSGANITTATVNGGVQNVADSTSIEHTTVNGGTQNLASNVTIATQTVSAGAVASGGTITGTQNVYGTAEGATISGTQNVYGTAAGATISGTQHVYGGGHATATTIASGGTLIVEDKGTAQVAAIDSTNAVVELRDLGDATVIFGGSANENFTVPTLSATGDNVRLRAESDFTVPTAAADGHKELTVTNMTGHADFYVNTDVANNAADIVHITNVTGASSANKIRINYDPTLAAGNAVASTHTMVAESVDGKATFEGAKSTVGGLSYLPTVTAEGNDWYITKVDSLGASEASHHTLMAMTAATAALAAGTAFIDDAARGLSLASNVGADGVSSFAKMGGGSVRQETGSHVDVHTWNAILALGHANKKERGTFEYGAFFEYGSGNYTTECEDTRRGDGSLRYTGGGVLAKWTDAHGLYVEGSFRAGTVHDDARDVLHDDMNTYSYETDAGYLGAHLGVGREIALADGNSVDVYGKYFMSRRNGVSFRTGGNAYDLDAVRSQVLRVGARYMMKREKWNFYGGLAYEHEFDGMANGTVDGHTIRGADIGGGSFRAELGATMTPGENSPWKLDLNLAGFAGKKQGVSGGISVAFMF